MRLNLAYIAHLCPGSDRTQPDPGVWPRIRGAFIVPNRYLRRPILDHLWANKWTSVLVRGRSDAKWAMKAPLEVYSVRQAAGYPCQNWRICITREFAALHFCICKREMAPNWHHWRANADELAYAHTKFLQNSIRWYLMCFPFLVQSNKSAAVCRQSLMLWTTTPDIFIYLHPY